MLNAMSDDVSSAYECREGGLLLFHSCRGPTLTSLWYRNDELDARVLTELANRAYFPAPYLTGHRSLINVRSSGCGMARSWKTNAMLPQVSIVSANSVVSSNKRLFKLGKLSITLLTSTLR